MQKQMSVTEAMRLSPEDPLRTFSEDENLPPLPLPSLSHTLERYLDSVRPFVTDAEFAKTQEIVKKFENGEGKALHKKLEDKAKIEKNWVDQWWLDKAYLENRWSLVPFCSMSGVSDLGRVWTFKPGKMLKYASLYMYYTVEMWTLLRSERLAPNKSADGKTFFSMAQWRRLFNCCRVPLPGKDRLDVHFKTEKEGPCPSHVIVTCNGHIFLVDAVDKATGSVLNPLEWETQLQIIVDEASKTPGQGIARFTCDDRDIWAKNNAHLRRISGENAHYLHLIESAMCLLSLEPNIEPLTQTDIVLASLNGDYNNLWVDKSVHIAFFGNGQSGGLAEHTAFDGMISVTNSIYTYHAIVENNGVWTGPTTLRKLSPPHELKFILDSSITEELQQATLRQNISRTKVIAVREKFTEFGKAFAVKSRIHPDIFVQMALQLTYYRMHNKFAPCYETATTRAFYNGRTETLRVCTKEVASWVQAMVSPQTSAEEKIRRLIIAVKRHDELMKEAREANGCDRHLFGLYCVAEENKIPIPELFRDASYAKSGGGGNFVLSTSLVGYSPIGGGVAPMCLDGYGIFYNMDSQSMYFMISAMRDSAETSATKFFNHLCESFCTMKEMIDNARGGSKKSHL